MRPVFKINRWDDPGLIGKWFRSRLDWMPFGSGTRSYFWNWMDGQDTDFCKHRHNVELETVHPITIPFYPDHLPLFSTPLVKPLDFFGQQLTHISSCLVSNFRMNTGRIIINAELSCDPHVIESFWGLSPARVERLKDIYLSPEGFVLNFETILPEYDFWETNTPGHIGEMSSSVITSYAPYKAVQVKKRPMQLYQQVREYVIEVKDGRIWFNFDETGGYMRRPCSQMPIELILWNAVGKHQAGPDRTVTTKIYEIKYEI